VLAGVCALLVIGWMILTRIDFLGDMVLMQVQDAVQTLGDVKLEISPLRGNPVTGFKGTDLVLMRGDETLLASSEVGVDISLPSVLTGSPRVGLLHVAGLRTNVDAVMSMLPAPSENSEPVDIPINKVQLDDAQIDTQWGVLTLDKSSVRLRGASWFDLNLHGALDGTSGEVLGVVEKKEENWTLDDLRLKLAGGTIWLDGAVYPSPDLSVKLDGVNLAEAAAIVPQLRKAGIFGDFSGEATVVGLGPDMKLAGTASLKKALIFGVPLPQVSAQWDYKKDLIRVKLDEGRFFQSSVAGDFLLDLRPEEGYLELNASVHNLRFDDWSDKLTEFPNAVYVSGGITSLDAKVTGPLNALEGSVELAPSSIRYKKIEIADIQGRTLFAGRPSGEVDFSADYRGNKMTLLGTVSFAEGVPADLRFDAGSLVLDELGEVFEALKPFSPKGNLSAKKVSKKQITLPLFSKKLVFSAAIQMKS